METLQTSPASESREYLRMPPLSAITGFDRRRHDRLDTKFKAKISTPGQKIYCDVEDISVSGARVRPHSEIDAPTITLHVLGVGSWYGDVVWNRNGEIGVHFRSRMDTFTLSSVL